METEIWFAIDHRTSECGYVAASSLLQNRPDGSHTNLRIAYVQGSDAPADWWHEKLSKSLNKSFSLRQIPIETKDFLGTKLIFDSITTYLRIAIPLYAGSEKIIYLDADVVIQDDVSKLESSIGPETFGMLKDGFCGDRCEKEKFILQKYGKKSSDPYFNAGVCVINTKNYRENLFYNEAIKLIKNDSAYLAVYDQTVLNCVLSNPSKINKKWNFCVFPKAQKDQFDCSSEGLVHFVGSPKPWDLLGEFYHPFSKVWVDAARRAGLRFTRARKYFQFYSWKRAWRIRKQYAAWSNSKNNRS